MKNSLQARKRGRVLLLGGIGALFAALAVAGFGQTRKQITNAQAVSSLKKTSALIDVILDPDTCKARWDVNSIGQAKWIVSGKSDKGDEYWGFVDAETGDLRFFENLGLANRLNRREGRTGRRFFASDVSAQKELLRLAKALDSKQEYAVEDLRHFTDSRNTAGQVSAFLAVLVNGYRFVDRNVGYKILLDPQDGSFWRFTGSTDCPVVTSPASKISSGSAKSIAASRLEKREGYFDTFDAIKGWAVPAGGSKAVLCWRLRNTQGTYTVFVNAATGAVEREVKVAKK